MRGLGYGGGRCDTMSNTLSPLWDRTRPKPNTSSRRGGRARTEVAHTLRFVT